MDFAQELGAVVREVEQHHAKGSDTTGAVERNEALFSVIYHHRSIGPTSANVLSLSHRQCESSEA